MENSLGNRIKNRRKQLNLPIKKIIESLGITRMTYSRYENDASIPSDKLVKLAELFETTPDYLLGIDNRETANLLYMINQLSGDERHEIRNEIRRLMNQHTNTLGAVDDVVADHDQTKMVPYLGTVSAGTGQLLPDDECCNEIEFHGPIPEHDYAVRVAGDSMEPLFDDGQLIFVNRIKDPDELHAGQIIIASVNGESFVKKLAIHDQQIALVSLNPKYQTIHINEWDDFEILGVVAF